VSGSATEESGRPPCFSCSYSGGIYGGFFWWRGGRGRRIGALVIGLARGRLSRRAIMMPVSSCACRFDNGDRIGAYLFGYFSPSRPRSTIVEFMVHLPSAPTGVLALIMIGYLILGAIWTSWHDLLTVPIGFR